jgi:hypothetical protein
LDAIQVLKKPNEPKGPSFTVGSNYTPTGSHIPQSRTATWNGTSWDISYRDALNGTTSMGSFVLVGGLGGSSGDRGSALFVSTSTPLGSAIERATAALDEWSGWASQKGKEVAGTINSKGEIIVGPESGRKALSSDPGSITNDTLATWHIHIPGVPGAGDPYRFSGNLFGTSDSRFLRAYPNMIHAVGVLDGPAGQFTIFAYLSPEQPFVWHRVNPGHTPGFPGG